MSGGEFGIILCTVLPFPTSEFGFCEMDQIGTRKFHIFVRERVCRRLRVLLWKQVSDGEEREHASITFWSIQIRLEARSIICEFVSWSTVLVKSKERRVEAALGVEWSTSESVSESGSESRLALMPVKFASSFCTLRWEVKF